MSNLNRHPVRRTAAGILASSLAFSGAFAAATPAFAAPGFTLDRVFGADRYATSAAIAAQFGSADGAILASGEARHIVDALSASFLAGVRQDPVLLTAEGQVSAAVLAQLNNLTSKNVTIVGGEAAVSEAVATQLRNAGFTVTRLAGVDRYETSEAIIRAAQADASPVGILVSGQSPVDALAAGALAYKGEHPVFLTAGGTIPESTLDAMQAAGTTSVIIVGGTTVVPESVRTQLAARNITVVTRLGGVDRSATSRLVADYLIENFGFSATTFNVASGANNGVDALSGAALSGKNNTVLLVTNTATDSGSVDEFATARANTLTAAGRIFGGTAVVAPAIETQVEQAGGAGTSFQTINVVPNDTARLTLADESGTTTEQNADNRTYTVAGLDNALRYRVTLVNGTSVQGTGTNRTFLSGAIGTTPETFAVDTGADIADIVAVGGINAEVGNTGGDNTLNTATVFPVNGSITFTIDGNAAGTVVPVVYVDGGQGGTATTGGASNRLETSATAAGVFAPATETFGLGGPTVYVQPAAPVGTITPAAVVETVAKDADQFASNQFTFTYDANDVFEVDGVRVTQAVFEANLSSGDTVTGSIATDPSLPSTFQLDDNDPAQAATPTVSVGTGASSNDVTVTVTVPAGVDAVQFQRAPVTNGTAGTFATIATEPATDDVTGTAGTQVVFADNDLAVGTYAYRVVLVNDGDTGAASAAVNATTTSPTAADTTAPTVADARVGTNTGSAFLLDSGDTFLLALSEAVAAPSNGDTIRVTDADGTLVDIVASDGNFALNTSNVTINGTTYAAGRVLTVTRGDDVVVVAGSQAGLGLPATITAQAGTTDAAGNQLNIAGSADVVIDTESGTVTSDTTAPTAATVSSPSAPVTVNAATFDVEGSAEAGSSIEVLNGTTVVGTATAGTDGAFTAASTLTQNAANDFTVVSVDASGNRSTATTVSTITEDSTAPTFNDTLSAVTETTTGDDTLSLVFSEAIVCSTLSAADITVTNTATTSGTLVTVTLTSCADNTAVFSIPDAAVATGENLLIEAVDTNDVTDLAGNVLPADEQTQDLA